jgi:hypothetical protein
VDRVAIYIFITLPVAFALTTLWPLITRKALGPIITSSRIGLAEELALYLACSFIGAIALAAVVPAASGVTLAQLQSNAVMMTILAWFLTGIVSAAMGILIERRSDETGKATMDIQPATSRPKQSPEPKQIS